MYKINETLNHYGVPGMKWGLRLSSREKTSKIKKTSYFGNVAKKVLKNVLTSVLNKKIKNVVATEKINSTGLKVSKMALMSVAVASFVVSEVSGKKVYNSKIQTVMDIVEKANPMSVKYNS